MKNNIKDVLSKFASTSFFKELVIPKMIQIAFGIVILYIANLLGKYFVALIEKKTAIKPNERKDTKQIRLGHRIAANIAYYGTLVVGVLILLKLFGIETASVIAVFGASGLAIGLAVQGTLTDLTSGILMALNRTIHMGEILQFGETTGRVVDFNMLNTTLEDVDTKALLQIPNRRFQDTIVVNLTRQTGRINMNVSIANSRENPPIERIIEILQAAVQKHPAALNKASIEVEDMSKGATVVNLKIPAKYYPSLQGEFGTYIRKELEKERVMLFSRNIREFFSVN